MQVLHTMARQFWEGGHGLRLRPTLPDNQFVLAYVDGLLLANLVEVTRAKHRRWHRSVALLVELSLYQRPLYAECRRRVHVLLAQTAYAVIHAAHILRMLYTVIHFFVKFV